MVVAAVPGARDVEDTESLVGGCRRRTGGLTMRPMTEDEAAMASRSSLTYELGTLESIENETKDGIYVAGMRSGSIDDHRLNFQFGPQIGYEIKNGRRGKIYKQPTYTGVTPQFWGSMDRVAGPAEFSKVICHPHFAPTSGRWRRCPR